MPRKANPNSRYSKRKAREKTQEYYVNLSSDHQKEFDNQGCVVAVIIIAIVLVIILASGGTLKDFSKWMTH